LARRQEDRDTRIAARELLHAVMLVMRSVAAELRRTSKKPLAPAQMGGLMRIARGPCTLSDLARHQAVSLPTVSKSVEMLVRRGWVERWVDKADRRQTLLRLSPKGRLVLADVKERAEQHLATTLAPLAKSERAQLTTAAQLLTRMLKPAGEA
jgi:DNA-binding MarR family transcriptional regulator